MMAVPKRRTFKAKQRKRCTHKGLDSLGGLLFDASSGEYRRSHRISKDGYYNGKKV